jgi:hypothetical protein
MIVDLELVDGITHSFCPKTMRFGNYFHLVDEIIVDNDAFDLKAVGERSKSGNRDECYLNFRFVPVCVFHRIRLEGDFGTELCREYSKLANGIAGTNLIFVNFEEGRRAVLVEHVANDGDEFIFVVVDRGGLVYQTDLFFLVMKRREEIWSGEMPCPSSLVDQKVQSGLISEGGFKVE